MKRTQKNTVTWDWTDRFTNWISRFGGPSVNWGKCRCDVMWCDVGQILSNRKNMFLGHVSVAADSPQVTLIFHGRLKTSSKFIHFFHNTWEKLSSGAPSGESPVTSCSSFSVCLSTSCHITPSAGTSGAVVEIIYGRLNAAASVVSGQTACMSVKRRLVEKSARKDDTCDGSTPSLS